MITPTPEFSRLVPLVGLGPEPFRREIEATPDECRRLAQRFGLIALDRLVAAVTVNRMSSGWIRLEAAFEAEFAQTCVVTLDPVPGAIAQTFSLLYGPSEDVPSDLDCDLEGPVFEPLSGDAIDIGEAVAQELSLALPEFPRQADAVLEPVTTDDTEDGPLAALAGLSRLPQS